MKVIVLDIETTGLYPNNSEFLQVTILSGSGRVLFNKYIKPDDAKEWPEAEKINHISPKMVEHCKSIDDYVPKIQKIINRADVVVGYNHKRFDIPFLESVGVDFHGKEIVDVFLEVKDNYPKGAKLKQVARANGYYFIPHDSLEDCKATLFLFNKAHNGKMRGKNKVSNVSNVLGSSIQIGRNLLLFLLGVVLFSALGLFLQEIVESDVSVYLAIAVSGACCFKMGLLAGPLIGPLYYLIYQLFFGGLKGMAYTLVLLIAISILIEILIVLCKRFRNRIPLFLSGTLAMLIAAVASFYLIPSINNFAAASIVFVCLEIVFLTTVFKETITTQ